MKKLAVFLVAISLLLSVTIVSKADSPVTSTSFYKAYTDIAIVSKAAEQGVMDEETADYLADPENPIDIKAAVINALSWDFNGKNNTESYINLIYNKQFDDIDLDSLSGQELFCIGYLKAMDDYFDTAEALAILKKAEAKIMDSMTVSIVRAVVEAQNSGNVWERVETVINDKSLNVDMRLDAINIIIDYMSLYSDSPITNPFMIRTDPSTAICSVGKTIFLTVSGGTPPYEIASFDSIVSAYILYYKNDTLMVTGRKEGSCGITIRDSKGVTQTLPVTVAEYQDIREEEKPDDTLLPGNTPGNNINGGYVAASGDWLFFSMGHPYYTTDGQTPGLYKIKTDGSTAVRLCYDIPFQINESDGWVYYRNMSDFGKLYRISTDGAGRTKLCDDEPCYMTVSDGWIYYSNLSDKGALYKIRLNGTQRIKLNNDNHSSSLQLVGDWIYYSNLMDNYKIYRIKTDGSGRTKISDDGAWYINESGGWIYYINKDHSDKLYKMKTDGTEKKIISGRQRGFHKRCRRHHLLFEQERRREAI